MGSSGAGAYEIERSLRFDVHTGTTSGAHLQRTFGSAGNRKTWTFSFWAKKTWDGDEQVVFNGGGGGNGNTTIRWDDNESFHVFEYNSGFTYRLHTNRLFRDHSAWYHIVVTLDTTQGTADNRIKIYVNGVQETSFANRTNPAQDTDYTLNNNIEHTIGNNAVEDGNANYFNGYLTEIHFVDGTALDHTSFGKTDAETGQWIPKKYGGSHGTNGFYLNFSDNSNTTSSTLGDDDSANTNDWTCNNFSVAAGVGNDSLEDTPTNNYATINPLAGYETTFEVPANGNLDFNLGSTDQFALSSFLIPPSGKWYAELVYSAIATGRFGITNPKTKNDTKWNGVEYYIGGIITVDDSTVQSSLTAVSNGDIVGIKVDRDAGTIAFTIGGSASGSAVNLSALSDSSELVFAASRNSSSGSAPAGSFNFGQRAFSHLPADYKALCSANLPEPTIKKGSNYFNPVIYTGNGSTSGDDQAINSVGFDPDLVWIKNRSSANTHHQVFDTARSSGDYALSPNGDGAEYGFSAFDFISGGFEAPYSSSSSYSCNTNSETYVAWNWKESATAGFDIVGFNPSSGTDTYNHSLGVKPDAIFIKSRGSSANWEVYHSKLTAENKLYLNASDAQIDSGFMGDTEPTSSVFSYNPGSQNGNNHIAYLFSNVEGYSKMGSYTGNGNADGTFVYLGFKPAYVVTKASDRSSHWYVWDSTRSPFNQVQKALWHDYISEAEGDHTAYAIDFLSNGFKVRNNQSDTNTSGSTSIYMAFAETPFKYANAR